MAESRSSRIARAAPLLLIAAVLCSSAQGKIIYVDDDANGLNTGLSWANAYRYLQDALADANTAERPVEVRVAQGIYRPDQGAGITPGDREATFRLLNGVAIKGGYAGLGQPDPNAWDPAVLETFLWGDLNGNDHPSDKTSYYDNSHRIVIASQTDETAVLEGFTITRGAFFAPFYRNGPSEPEGGIGIYNKAGRPTILRCVFSHNQVERARGPAMLNYKGAAPRLEECTFRDNDPGSLCDQESASIMRNCRFVENRGAAVQEVASQSQFEGCSFAGNWGPALSGDERSHAALSHCTFTNNRGAIYGQSVLCTDCVFAGNTAQFIAGAVTITDGTFIRCEFRDNSTTGTGGALNGKNLTLQECVLTRNSAWAVGAIACQQADIRGCLIAGNRSDYTGALRILDRGKLTACTVVGNRSIKWGTIDARGALTVTGCIIRDNPRRDTSFPQIVLGRPATISFSCLEALPYPVDGLGRMDTDPCFVDPGRWDPNGTPDDPNDDIWIEGDYHLKSQGGRWEPVAADWVKDDVTSPCIDAGDPNTPVGDEPPPNGGRINMGFYGGTAEASKSLSGIDSGYGGGTGMPDNPFLIYSAEQMNSIGANPSDWNKHFRLMEDIDLAAYKDEQFHIIGTKPNHPFAGTFDGSGHTIANFAHSSKDVNEVGLFGYVNGPNAQITNLSLIDPGVYSVSGDRIGSLVGHLKRGTVRDCQVSGSVRGLGANEIGGLIGSNEGDVVHCHAAGAVNAQWTADGQWMIGGLIGDNAGTVTDCDATASVTGNSYWEVGGLIGQNWGRVTGCRATGSVDGATCVGGLTGSNFGTLVNCHATGNIAGDNLVGGLVGYNEGDPGESRIRDCHATGAVTGMEQIGGLVGRNDGILQGCYASGSAKAVSFAGGLAGTHYGVMENCRTTATADGYWSAGGLAAVTSSLYDGGLITCCYAAGRVSSPEDAGGLVACQEGGRVEASFWDITTSGQTKSEGGTGKTTAQMKTAGTFLSAGWDFIDETANGAEDIWWILDGQDYPRLSWESAPHSPNTDPDSPEN